jgi:acyl dehydratase
MIAVGTQFPEATITVTREMLIAYAEASGDHNEIHLDEAFALSVGLPNVIAHGMLTMGLTTSVLESWLGRCDAIEEIGTRFTKPVVVPESGTTITVAGSVTEALDDGRFRIDLTVHSGDVKVLGMTRAIVRL